MDIMLPDFSQASYLTQSVIYGDLGAIRSAIWTQSVCEKWDVNECDEINRSPLHAAAYFGKDKILEELIGAGARVNCKDVYGLTPLHLACHTGHDRVVNVLLEHDADVNARDKAWHTALHVASANNALECIKSLLPFVVNINVTDREGRTCLHHAALNNYPDLLEMLIHLGCAVNACDKRYRRPLHWAVHQSGCCEAAEVLVRLGADVNAKDKDLYTPLHACCNSVQHVQLLLDSGAEIDAKTCEGNTPLHIACMKGYADMVRELVAYSAPIDDVNDYGETPLMMAAASPEGAECMEILLAQGADVNHCCHNQETALHRTAKFGRLARAALLLETGSDIDAADASGATVLHIAAARGYQLLCSTLLAKNADPKITDNRGHSPFHKACQIGSVECCRIFTKLGLNLDVQDVNGMTALHLAADSGSIACLELLVSSGAALDILDNKKRTALHYAAAKGTVDAVSNLVLYGANPETSDWFGCTPLLLAACYDLSGSVVEYLLKRCSDVNVADGSGFGVLHYAAVGGNVAGLQQILQCSDLRLETSVTSPITIAVHYGYERILQLLLPIFGSVIETNSKGETVIDMAARRGHAAVLDLLLAHFRPPPSDLRTALAYSVHAGCGSSTELLLQYGVPVNAVDESGRSVLFQAVFTGHLDIVESLASHGANIYCKDKLGKTAVHLAAQCGRQAVLSYLLRLLPRDCPALLDARGFSLLHWACHRCHPPCVQLLLECSGSWQWGCHPFTPVHTAATHANDRCLAMLLRVTSHANVLLKDHKGRTPLHIATLCNSIACMKLLLSHNAQHDAEDNHGRTPYQIAAIGGLSNAMALLHPHHNKHST